MKKLLFTSLLTAAVVFAQATGGSDNKPGAAERQKRLTQRSAKAAEVKSSTAIPKKGVKKSSGSIEIMSYSSGAAQTGVKTGGSGVGAGKVNLNDLKIVSKNGGKNGTSKVGKQPPAKRPEAAPPGK
jgi:hypothetical protein